MIKLEAAVRVATFRARRQGDGLTPVRLETVWPEHRKFRSLNPGFLVGYREYQGSFRKPQTRSAELPAHGRLLRRQSQNFFGGAAMSKFWSLLLNWILGLGL